MARIIRMILVAEIALSASPLWAQEFYHWRDTAFAVAPSNEKITFQFDTTRTLPELGAFLAEHPCLRALADEEHAGRGFLTVGLAPECDYDAASLDLLNDTVVSRVVPVYVALCDSSELKVSDRVSVRFHRGLRPDSMLAILTAHGLHLLDSSRYAHGMWWCALDDTTDADPLECANRLHGFDAVWWASPTFSAEIRLASDPNDP